MPVLTDLLDRFRPAGAPGPAAAAAVPAEPGAEAQRELAPIFAALSDVERECGRIRDAAAGRAAQRVRRAERAAAELIRAARQEAPAERARVAAEVRAQGAAELAEIAARGEAQAATVRTHAGLRMPALVEAALTHVYVQLSTLVGADAVAGLRRGMGVGN